MIQRSILIALALAGLAGCATREPDARPSYLQMAMTLDKRPDGQLILGVGVADPIDEDHTRIQRPELSLSTCAWSRPRTVTALTADLGMVAVMDGGVMKGPKAVSRDLSAEFDRLVAARGLHPAPEELACARRQLTELAFSEDTD